MNPNLLQNMKPQMIVNQSVLSCAMSYLQAYGKKFFLISLGSLTLFHCVTVRSGSKTKVSDSLSMHCSAPDWLTQDVAQIQCNFENTSRHHILVSVASFTAESRAISRLESHEKSLVSSFITMDVEETNSFLSAYRFQGERKRFNTDVLFASLVVSPDTLASKQNRLTFGGDHLLGGAASLAPGSSMTKTVLIYRDERGGSTVDFYTVDFYSVCLTAPESSCLDLDVSRHRAI